MNPKITNLFCAVFLSAIAHAADPRAFKFTAPDEKLLTQANELDEQFEKKGLVDHDVAAEDFLNGIGKRLLDGEATPERVVFKFRILRDPMVNAFALPNGSIYVNTGLIAAMENEAELAAVMAHEITHVTNRHTYFLNRDIRKKAVTMDVIVAAAAGASFVPLGTAFGYSILLAANMSQVLLIASIYGYSRELEGEADTVGYHRLIHADYGGAAMARSFELLDERIEFEPTEPFWRTHPKLQQRIATAKQMLEKENASHPDETTDADYFAHLAPVIQYNIGIDLDCRRAGTAADRAERLLKWEPQNAVDRTLLADAYRSLGAKTPRRDKAEESKETQGTARKQMLKMTEDEEQRALLTAPNGKATLEANRAKAETLYKQAITDDPQLGDPHRGLGMLYQDEAKREDSARQYRAYLELAPADAADRLRIERRLDALAEKASDKK